MSAEDRMVSKKKIGEFEYHVRKLDPYDCMDLVHDVTTSLAPAAGGLFGAVIQTQADAKKILDGVGAKDAAAMSQGMQASLESVFRNLTKERQREWTDKMRDQTVVVEGGKEIELAHLENFNAHFGGRTGQLYRWLVFALHSQCDDFLPGNKSVIDSVVQFLGKMAPLKSPGESKNTPIAGA